jgi:hypothetical protein
MENIVKKQRKQRRNFERERTELVLFCRISLGILNGLIGDNIDSPLAEFNKGQCACLRAVLKRLGEEIE